jgi:hypothetical protein
MDRRTFISGVTVGLLAAPLAAAAQAPGKGMLTGNKQWTFYYEHTRVSRPIRPRFGSVAAGQVRSALDKSSRGCTAANRVPITPHGLVTAREGIAR